MPKPFQAAKPRIIMSTARIKDYLQTQGLKLPLMELQTALAGIQAVMHHGRAEIDHTLLWHDNSENRLSPAVPYNTETEMCLRQIFMALDSTFSQCPTTAQPQSAVVYLLLPETPPVLLRLTQQGKIVESRLTVDESCLNQHLAQRSAHTGWLNIVNEVPTWLDSGDLQGTHHQRAASQIALPVCADSGAVLGVIYLESGSKNGFADAENQVPWVALAVALAKPLQELLTYCHASEESHD